MTDLSFNGKNGTAVGGMTVGTAASHSGVANGATNFDGVDDYVDFGDKAVFDFTTAFTIALWLNIPSDTPDSYRGILAKYNASTGYDLGLANGLLNLSVRGSSQISTGNSGTTVRGRGYTHVVFTVTNSAIWRYIDGTADVAPNPATGTWTSVAASGYSLQIGHRNGGSTYLPAGISDVRIYNRALSQTEITSLYNSN